ncbi:MAG: nucleoside monophosphate kinase [Symplocastrum torsivum CPER-KK1]|jgi:adenylate kinase family enzyme|uniref:Adenylate kinase n=1 Tax=Symplocastrum torsivum CPER-KK1 TaxID=450513 RepID=A0A951UBR1_9CYAN|nr:nucleoside monophosphate kinase [Symplocastrum torsivum CPER-KK1]
MFSSKKAALFVLGLPGSGKSSLVKSLSAQTNFTQVSIGCLLRKLLEENQNNENTKVAKEVILKGTSTPYSLVVSLIKEELAGKSLKNIVFDGYPRDAVQLTNLENLLSELDFSYQTITGVWLDACETLIKERLQKRVICSSCGNPSENNSSVCSMCGGSLIQRLDDTQIQSIRSRISWFNSNVKPVIQSFESNYSLLRIPASHNKEFILNKVLTYLKENRV